MRRANYFIPTLRESPADATAVSHKLLLRSGLVRMLSAGIYSFLPLGWRAARNAEAIIREEMERIGGQEFYLPALNPIDIWDETGRSKDFGEEMFRLNDRKGHAHCLAPTHEEIICSIARGEIRSWRDLPQVWYQIQLKFRDEPRPRGGMLRIRQFIMKDSYSLDLSEEGLDHSYNLHREAYERIFQRCGLDYFIVGASSGLMGGGQSQEFMYESEAGEDSVVRCSKCGFAANLEVASSTAEPVPQGPRGALSEVETPHQRTVEEVSRFLNIPTTRMVKTLLYVSSIGPIMALVSGEDELSEAKLSAVVGGPVRPAHPEEVREWMKADVGFLGPHGGHRLPIYADLRLEDAAGMVSGANRNGYHVVGIEFGRDCSPEDYVDLRAVKAGEGCPACGAPVKIVKAIELGHIFKLGTKYSRAMGATVLSEDGQETPIVMGSYGIGVERIIAAAIETNADADGIRWNSALAPFEVIIIQIGADRGVIEAAERMHQELENSGFDVLLDDRDARPGVKMKDADLIGIPVHVLVSPRNLQSGQIELKSRWTGERSFVPVEELTGKTAELLEEARPRLEQL